MQTLVRTESHNFYYITVFELRNHQYRFRQQTRFKSKNIAKKHGPVVAFTVVKKNKIEYNLNFFVHKSYEEYGA